MSRSYDVTCSACGKTYVRTLGDHEEPGNLIRIVHDRGHGCGEVAPHRVEAKLSPHIGDKGILA